MEDDDCIIIDLDLLPSQQQQQQHPPPRKRKNAEPMTEHSNAAPEFLALPRTTTKDYPPPLPKKPHTTTPTSAPSATKPLSAFLEELTPNPPPPPPQKIVKRDTDEPSYPTRSFPRYHDYNIDEVNSPTESSFWVSLYSLYVR